MDRSSTLVLDPSGSSVRGSPRVLLVDDAAEVRHTVGEQLMRHGMVVMGLPDGERFTSAVSSFAPDVIVLDLNLPGADGLDLLQDLRQGSTVPVIVITGRSHETDRVVGLEMGADDYVVKPFSAIELAARIRAVLRRSREPERQTVVHVGNLTLDTAAREVLVDGEPVAFTHMEFELLAFFVTGPPRRVYSREQLLAQVWSSSASWQNPATVTEHVRRIRAKLAAANHPNGIIETVRGAGYRFQP